MKVLREFDVESSDELSEILSEKEDGYYYRFPKSKVQDKTEQLGNFLYIYVKRFEKDERVNKHKAFIDADRLFERAVQYSQRQ